MFLLGVIIGKNYNLNGEVELPTVESPPEPDDLIECPRCHRQFSEYRIVYIDGVRHKFCGYYPECSYEFQ